MTSRKDAKDAKQKCRVCGCTDLDCTQCIVAQGYPCQWVEDDLCSRCAKELGYRAAEPTEKTVSQKIRRCMDLREMITRIDMMPYTMESLDRRATLQVEFEALWPRAITTIERWEEAAGLDGRAKCWDAAAASLADHMAAWIKGQITGDPVVESVMEKRPDIVTAWDELQNTFSRRDAEGAKK